jgi:urease accessory protein
LRNDLILLACAWRASAAQNHEHLGEIIELAAALQPSAERFLEATQQGRSFLMQIEASWSPPRPMPAIILNCDDMVYAVAVGIASALHEIPMNDVLLAYAIAFVGNLLSAAIRLSVIGPTEGQQLLSELTSDLIALAAAAETSTLQDLGSATWRSDLASLLHETQHTRLFRS